MNKVTIKLVFLNSVFIVCLTSLFTFIACNSNTPSNDANFDLHPGIITKPDGKNGW